MKQPFVVVACHANFDSQGRPYHGTGSELDTYLLSHRYPFVRISHSLFGGFNSYIEDYTTAHPQVYRVGMSFLPLPLRVFQDIFITFYLCLKFFRRIDIFIGIDPINGAVGVIFKKLHIAKYTIFYTADYALKRFPTAFLNWLYHSLDHFCLRGADRIWNVSTRMMDVRTKQGVARGRNIFVPNSPQAQKIKIGTDRNRDMYRLVLVSFLEKNMHYSDLFDGVHELHKKYPALRLTIVGSGPYEKQLHALAVKKKISKNIEFLGRKTHEEILALLPSCGIGIAAYTGQAPWLYFGDSMKVREYIACGLPVIMTDVSSTADDIKQAHAGFVISFTRHEFIQTVDHLLRNRAYYKKVQKNVEQLAKKTDITKILNKQFTNL